MPNKKKEVCLTSNLVFTHPPVVLKSTAEQRACWKQTAGIHSQAFWFSKSRVGWGMGLSNKFPSEADAAGTETTLWDHSGAWSCM